MVVPAVAVLIVAGLQIPDIPFVDVNGKDGADESSQRGPICANAGVIEAVTTISIVTTSAH